MHPEMKLDSNLLQALARDTQSRRVFDVVVGFAPGADDSLAATLRRTASLSAVGPRTAAGALTRDQLLEVAAHPVVKYLKLVERLVSARS